MISIKTKILSSPASLYNGKQQLPGTLVLTDEHLLFTFDDYRQSHLNLQIPLADIERAEEFLIFNLTRNGLKITGRDGHFDLFVLDDVRAFKKALLE